MICENRPDFGGLGDLGQLTELKYPRAKREVKIGSGVSLVVKSRTPEITRPYCSGDPESGHFCAQKQSSNKVGVSC